jgi:hypothetical protein
VASCLFVRARSLKMRRPVALLMLFAVLLGTSCASSSMTSSPKTPIGPKAPCSSQPPPPSGLLSCDEARAKGAPWLSSDMQAQLGWYTYQDDSEPIEVWTFTQAWLPIPVGGSRISNQLISPASPTIQDSPSTCGVQGTVVDAHTGAFIVEGFNGSPPTPCPSP